MTLSDTECMRYASVFTFNVCVCVCKFDECNTSLCTCAFTWVHVRVCVCLHAASGADLVCVPCLAGLLRQQQLHPKIT